MEIVFQRTKKQLVQSFLRAFYSQRPWRFIRIIGGPLMILIAYFLLQFPYTWQRGFSYFCIGFGIYYIIKPFLRCLFILRRPAEPETAMELDEEEKLIRLTSQEANSEIKLMEPYIQKLGKWGILLADKKIPQLRLPIPAASVKSGDWQSLVELTF